MYASGGWGGNRYRAGGLTSQFALAQLNGGGDHTFVCEHAAPPSGYHYEQPSGTTSPCALVLKPNATGSGNNNGSGTGSNTGTGSGTGTTVTPGGTGTGTTTTPAADPTTLSPELTKALWIAAIIWLVSKVFFSKG